MKHLFRLLLSLVGIGPILLLWWFAGSPYFGFGIRTPFESAASYHLRMMYFHGREKDGQDYLNAAELVALGERGVPELAEHLQYHLNPRCQPSPFELIAFFPAAAHRELGRRIDELQEPAADRPDCERDHFLHRRINLTTILILASNDWSWFDLWLDDIQAYPGYNGFSDLAIPLMKEMLKALLKDEDAPRPFRAADVTGAVVLEPAFLDWWKANRARIVAAEAQGGYRNATGWRPYWIPVKDGSKVALKPRELVEASAR